MAFRYHRRKVSSLADFSFPPYSNDGDAFSSEKKKDSINSQGYWWNTHRGPFDNGNETVRTTVEIWYHFLKKVKNKTTDVLFYQFSNITPERTTISLVVKPLLEKADTSWLRFKVGARENAFIGLVEVHRKVWIWCFKNSNC